MMIVVGVDGSVHSQRALGWCARYAGALDARVVAVHALEVPAAAWRLDVYAPPLPTDDDGERILEMLREQWCKALTDANVPFEAKVVEGDPANVIIEVAQHVKADLVVTGRRGLGGFKEMMLGSTSHHLSHHLPRPLVIVP